MNIKKVIHVVDTLDWHVDYLLSADEWACRKPAQGFPRELQAWLITSMYAAGAILKGEKLGEMPHIGYDATSGRPILVVKCDNNGTTLIVSDCRLPHLVSDEDDVFTYDNGKLTGGFRGGGWRA